MAILVRKNRNQQEGKYIKENTSPDELQRGTRQEQVDGSVYAYPYTGYHRTTIEDYLTAQHSTTTADGYGSVMDPNKGASPYSRQYLSDGTLIACGINWYTRHVQRLEMLIKSTGELVTLYRRKWTGERCPCYDQRRGHSRHRCDICFGTGFVGGYTQYVNIRESDGRIWLRPNVTVEDLELKEEGMFQKFIPDTWTLPTPIVRDRDVIIRYDPNTDEEVWRYEILNVGRNLGFFKKMTRQEFSIQRLDKTDPIYNIRVVDLEDNSVGHLSGETTDVQQQQIALDHEDGYGDLGYSEGYMRGYTRGYYDGNNNLDFYPVKDEDVDGYLDSPYGRLDIEAYGKNSFMEGYVEGYTDGFEDGTIARTS